MRPTPNGVQAEFLKAARKGQEFVGHAIRTSAGKVRSVRPQLHELHLPLAHKLPKPDHVAGNVRDIAARLPKPEELAKRLPKPEQLVGNVRGMTARLPKREELAGNARDIAARLPKPEELAGSAAGLAGKLLASQRKFADQVLRVTTPQLPGKSGTAETSTPKTSTPKTSTPKTSTAASSTARNRPAKNRAAKDAKDKDSGSA